MHACMHECMDVCADGCGLVGMSMFESAWLNFVGASECGFWI